MKLKIVILAILTLFAFLFSACDWLSENDDNNENPPVTGNPPGDNFEYVVGTTLIQTKWDQRTPYNDLFPLAPNHAKANTNGELPTDCNTTATVQIIAFHRRPIKAVGTSSVLGPHGINVQLVNFENYPFDWANMRNTYTTADPGTTPERKAVAELNFVYGMARGNGIGTARTIVEHFGYDRSIQNHRRSHYSDTEWEAMIREQLNAGLPVIYSGLTDAGGSHVFVIDGYDNNGKFHVNWGWSGRSDGWYFLNSLIPSASPNDHYRGNTTVINIKPDAGSVGSNVFGINDFTVSKTFVSQNELFTVTVDLESFGYFIGGQAGAALVDDNGKIIRVIGTANYSARNPTATGIREMNCYVPETVSPKQYQLKVVTRVESGEWKIVTASNKSEWIPNVINLTVTAGEANGGGYEQTLTNFYASQYSASYGEQFTVTFQTRNMSADKYSGGLQGAALVDNNGNIVAVIGSRIAGELNSGSTRTAITINCKVPNIVQSGQYRLRIVIGITGSEELRIATLSLPNIPNSYNFEVK